MIRPALTEIGIFLIPFAVYALFLVATRSGLLVQSSWPAHRLAKLVLGSLLLRSHVTASKSEVRKITLHMLYEARRDLAEQKAAGD